MREQDAGSAFVRLMWTVAAFMVASVLLAGPLWLSLPENVVWRERVVVAGVAVLVGVAAGAAATVCAVRYWPQIEERIHADRQEAWFKPVPETETYEPPDADALRAEMKEVWG